MRSVHKTSAFACADQRQSGVVLPVALFVLVAATLLTLGLIKGNIMALKVGGVSVIAAETQTAAELVLGNFFGLNPTSDSAKQNRYKQSDAKCGNADEIAANTAFDCTLITDARLPPGVHAVQPTTQRILCDTNTAPRSEYPSDNMVPYSHVLIEAAVTNDIYGAQAQVGAGVAAYVQACPH